MTMANPNIDGGKEFDWGRVSAEYAKYRDIYPPEFYDRILARSLCRKGQSCLDIGTGTGRTAKELVSLWCSLDGDGHLREPDCAGAKTFRRNAD